MTKDRSNSTLKLKFTSLKHSIQKQLRDSYNNYIGSIVMDQQDNNSNTGRPNKRLYTFIKQQKSDSREINSLKSNGINYTLPTDKANILNTQFQSVFTKLVPLKLRHLVEFLLPRKLSSLSMQNITVSVSGVSKQLLKLNPGKAAGPDNISPRNLKELHNEIAPILTDIFNTSLSKGIVPDDWKNAYVTPVYKKRSQMQTRKLPPNLTNLYLLQSLRTYYHFKYYVISRQKTIFYFTTSMGLGVRSVVRPSLSSSLRTCMTP